MSKLPQPFWAVVLAFFGLVLALAVLFHAVDVNLGHDVLGIASSFVTGALGAFAGHASGSNSNTDVKPGNGPITINQPPGA